MKNNDLMRNGNSVVRILDIENNKYLIIECMKKSMPKWVDNKYISQYSVCKDDNMNCFNTDIEPQIQKIANERFNIIAPILPFICQKDKRCAIINQIAEERDISRQTVCNYLWLYLSQQNI